MMSDYTDPATLPVIPVPDSVTPGCPFIPAGETECGAKMRERTEQDNIVIHIFSCHICGYQWESRQDLLRARWRTNEKGELIGRSDV
jgi:hypothetical protein